MSSKLLLLSVRYLSLTKVPSDYEPQVIRNPRETHWAETCQWAMVRELKTRTAPTRRRKIETGETIESHWITSSAWVELQLEFCFLGHRFVISEQRIVRRFGVGKNEMSAFNNKGKWMDIWPETMVLGIRRLCGGWATLKLHADMISAELKERLVTYHIESSRYVISLCAWLHTIQQIEPRRRISNRDCSQWYTQMIPSLKSNVFSQKYRSKLL